ncbi:MAG: coproporphyrinogen-III oxidase family protein [Acidobacteriota bacterium]
MSDTQPTTDPAAAASAKSAPGPSVHGPGAQSSTEVGSVFVSNYPPFSVWQQDDLRDYRSLLQNPGHAETPLGLYLHIPFCRKRCKFCYFRVYVDKNAKEIQRYLDALGREVELYAEQAAVQNRPIRFVYFGGGTPSYVAIKHLDVLLKRVQAVFPWDDVEEVTFECEPGTLTQKKVQYYREMGVTRLSVGVENWNEQILRDNGRAHEVKEIHRCLPWIREAGFDQLNIDLIAGMVGETWDSWKDSITKTIDLGPDSVTIYQMELPFNTVYSKGILAGEHESPVADWQLKRAWNDYAINELTANGYEVSSAYTLVKSSNKRSGKGRFVYRDSLWHGADMMGTGIASFGHIGGIHAQNKPSWNDYLETVEGGDLPLGRAFVTEKKQRLIREMILQMKLGALNFPYFRDKFGVDPLEEWRPVFERLQEGEMLDVVDKDRIELTRRGLLQVDSLLPNFYEESHRSARYT